MLAQHVKRTIAKNLIYDGVAQHRAEGRRLYTMVIDVHVDAFTAL
jgi:hypothetical protein